jgi:hypothetical protein
MKTIKQLNREAGEWIAFHWLRGAERILEGGRTPAPLSDWTKVNGRQWIPESVYKANRRWWVSDKNWVRIHQIAILHAKNVLQHIGRERYPLTFAHFTIKRPQLAAA